MQRRRLIQHLGAACAALGLPALAQAPKPLLLGQSAALSGPARELGEQFRSGAMLHFDKVNAGGGVAGRPIELKSLDDGYEPARCAANTRQLIDGGAFALFGYIGTPTSLAALPLVNAARIPFIAPFSGAEALRSPFNRLLFHVRASYFDETAEIVKQITAVGIKRVAVFYQDDAYGKTGLDGVTRALAPLGLAPTGLGTVERNSADVGAAVKSILAEHPDAIVQISAYKSCAAFIRAARAAGFGGTFYNVSFVGTRALAEALGPEARGVVVSQVMPYPFTPTTALAGDYLAAGQAAQGAKFEPNYGSIEGYVAARTLVEGLRRAGGRLTADGLIGGLESLHDLDLGGFYIDYSARKHTGSHFVELTMLTANGKVLR
ncbi:MAG: ABC transporter substrate-binding protein [Burkholderiales bacterium]|nr:ABC transporter substrate-binding protein [Burkholderiales bacterium]